MLTDHEKKTRQKIANTTYTLAMEYDGCIVSTTGRKVDGCEANLDRHSRGVLEGRVTLRVQRFFDEQIFGGVDGGKNIRGNMAHN